MQGQNYLKVSNYKKSSNFFLLTFQGGASFVDHFFYIYVLCFYAILSVHCSLVFTYWERANLLALMYAILSCVFVTFPYGVLGQVWYLNVEIPDLCLPTYF